jgi:glycosyltransferase involved in cell wall biosynthesis
MKILYAQKMIFPNHSAHAIHTALLAANFAAAGARVRCWPGVGGRGGQGVVENFYASIGCGGQAGLSLRRIPVSHKGLYGIFFRYALWAEALRGGNRETVFFASSVKEAVTALHVRDFFLPAKKIPVVFEAHHLISKLKQGRLARMLYEQEKAAFARADLVVFISETLRKDAEGYLPEPKRAIVSPLGFNDRSIGALPPPPPGRRERCIVYLGSLQQGKGVDNLVAALALLPENYQAKIIGGRPESALTRLREQAKALSLGNRIRFTGQLAHNEVAGALGECDIFAIPLTTQSDFYCPMKMYEAVGYALPVVSTPLPSMREILHDGEHALFAGDTSAEALAKALFALGENEDLRAGMRRANAALAEKFRASARAGTLLERIQAIHAECQ